MKPYSLKNALALSEHIRKSRARFDPIVEDPIAAIKYVRFADVKLPPPSLTLVHGLIGVADFSVIYGPSNSGKSFYALALAIAVASGRPFFGRVTQKFAVIYVAAESPFGIQRRLYAVKLAKSLGDVPIAIIPSSVSLFNEPASTDALIATAKKVTEDFGIGVGLIILDTFARVTAGADENSGKDVGRVIEHVDRIRAATGAHVSLIHHSGKSSPDDARGHSSLKAAVDTEIQVKDMLATVKKQRDGEMGAKMKFGLEIHPVGNDFESLIGIPILVEQEVPKETPKLGLHDRAALDLLRSLANSAGEITVSEWRAEYLKAGLAGGEKKEALAKGFCRAIETLRTKGLIAQDGLLVRLPREIGHADKRGHS